MSDGITITISAATAEAARNIQGFFNGLNDNLNKLTKAGEFVEGLGARLVEAFTVAAIVEQFKKAVESAEEFGQAVEKTGLSIKALNALRFQALESPIPIAFEQLVNALSLFNDKIYLAVRLGGDAARAFRDLGINVTDTGGRVLSTEAILAQVMDRFKTLPDGFQKNAAAMEMFGRSGRELIPMLNEGSDAMEKFQHAGGIDETMIANAREFHRAWEQLVEAFQQVFLEASKDIIPMLRDLASWLNTLQASSDSEVKASDALVDVFKALATVALDLKSVFVILGALVGDALAVAFENIKDIISTVIDIFRTWQQVLISIVATLQDMVVKAGEAASVLGDLAKGNFKKAWEDARETVAGMTGDLKKLGGTVQGEFAHVAADVGDFFDRGRNRAVTVWKLLADQVMTEATSFTDAVNKLWSKSPGAKPAGAGGESGTGGAAQLFGAPAAPQSAEAKKLLDEINKAWAEATESKIAVLDRERDELKKRLDQELHDEEELNARKAQVDELYARKKQQILDQQQDQQNKRSLDEIKTNIDLVDKNPDLTRIEKKEQLLPLLEQERTLLQAILQIEQQRAADPNRSQEDQNKAKNAIDQASRELAANQDKITQVSQTPFQKTLINLKQQWGDWSQQLATSFQSVFERSVSSISQGITGLIMGTKKWGDALREIGNQILTSIVGAIVEMGVRWVATQIMMALFGKTMAAASTAALIPIAEAQSAIWITPAILSDIASYGEASDQAPADVGIAIAAGQALSAISSFATGGMIPEGERFIRVNEQGQESVLNARATRNLGRNFINAINSGLSNAYDLARLLPSSFARPITSDAAAFQQLQAEGAAARAGAGVGGPVVQGHKLTAIITRNNQETLDALKTAEGERIIVDTIKRRRLDVGLNT